MAAPSDLEDLSEQDAALVEEFEKEWVLFLRENPEKNPGGKKAVEVDRLRAEVTDALGHKAAVETELNEQLNFLQKGFEKLEDSAKMQLDHHQVLQKKLFETLQEEIDKVPSSNKILSHTLPWEHFIETLDAVVTAKENAGVGSHRPSGIGARASARAYELILRTDDQEGDKLRAHQMDHALLSTQVKMLEKEIERYEKMTYLLDKTGEYLKDNHNGQ
eukprot:CAMPEP_0195257804 /NCGR_PEP_ID=MMETSP0706-20130129/7024_1 /TAXON_ID=33640 /ORGANISM="Asterionellopsis glacialis, Strain CCMP134" /LENGTH=217 /DNA_ID=CAMNT_0040311057 /DNA_START=21 /DNA_END=674 /DNA_ORIENTATION=+